MSVLAREINSLMNEIFEHANSYNAYGDRQMQYHTFSDENTYNLTIPLVGISKNELTVETHDGVLTVLAKPSLKSVFVNDYKKSFTLNTDADVDKIEAKLENGLLTLKVPKIKTNKKTVNVNIV